MGAIGREDREGYDAATCGDGAVSTSWTEGALAVVVLRVVDSLAS